MCDTSYIAEAFMQVIQNNRDVIAAVIVLTQKGQAYQVTEGRSALIKHLRKELERWFEPVVLPRKWLFANAMPLTMQGKIDQALIVNLLADNQKKLPHLLGLKLTPDIVELGLKVPQVQDLVYFPEHFPGFPILPGVVQLAWVEHVGKLFFGVDQSGKAFSHLEVIKFIQLIRPDNKLTLTLNWKADPGELCFNFSSGLGGCSSGRMVFKNKSNTPK